MILYGKIVDEPRYDQIEETNETYFYITVEDLKQNKQKVALSYNVSNDYEIYQKGKNIRAEIKVAEDINLNIATKINFITKQELIDGALKEYRKGNISLDNYINVCINNLQNDNTKEKNNLYKQDIKRNNVLSFKDKEIIENLTEDEIYRKIESYLKESIQLADIDTDIIGIQLVGSRTKGTNKGTSDLDVLIEYNNSEIHEDDLFNYLNDEDDKLYINGIKVDFNPINVERSGYNIKSWLKANYGYDKSLETKDEVQNISHNNMEETQKKVETIYEKVIADGLKDTWSGNYVIDLKQLKLNPKEENLFINMLNSDSRINYIEFNPKTKEVDIIFYLDYCPNAENKEENNKLDISIKDWYVKKYPSDDLGNEINDKVTFNNIIEGINNNKNIYEILEVNDSLVRERIFEKISNLIGVSYEDITNQWLNDCENVEDEEEGEI